LYCLAQELPNPLGGAEQSAMHSWGNTTRKADMNPKTFSAFIASPSGTNLDAKIEQVSGLIK
jgi:hypothetical protein